MLHFIHIEPPSRGLRPGLFVNASDMRVFAAGVTKSRKRHKKARLKEPSL